jgi:hypothetical protein
MTAKTCIVTGTDLLAQQTGGHLRQWTFLFVSRYGRFRALRYVVLLVGSNSVFNLRSNSLPREHKVSSMMIFVAST